MNTYICLLRGINVGGHNKIKMAELRKLCEELGLENVRTYIQSGNIVFQSERQLVSQLADLIQKGIQDRFGHFILTFVIDRESFNDAIVNNPFKDREDPDPKKLHLNFLYETVDVQLQTALRAVKSGRDEVILRPRVLYLYCPDGFGRTKYTDAVIKRILKTSGTTRNWRSVMKLQEMMES